LISSSCAVSVATRYPVRPEQNLARVAGRPPTDSFHPKAGSSKPKALRREGRVYVILILALAFVIAIGAVWTPIFALIIAVPLFVLFLVYVGLSRNSDERTGRPVSPEARSAEREGGIWGEERP